MATTDVRLDPKLNQEIWSRGVKDVPRRMRLKLESEYILQSLFTFPALYFLDPQFFILTILRLQESVTMMRVQRRSYTLIARTSQ
jgi:hypothetical protein